MNNTNKKSAFLTKADFRLAGAGGLGLVATTQSRVFDFGFAPRLRSSAALTVHWTVIHYRSPSSPPQIVSQQKEKAHEKIVDFIFLAGAGGLEPATHGFGVAPRCRKAFKILAFSHVSRHFSSKTTCRNCVWKFLMIFWWYDKISAYILAANVLLMLLKIWGAIK